ncbi:outer membrane lipoprotein Omp16 [Pyruvatibacter mobilis]|jgi:peptidoglycan-associated lipoprotein|nr:outer membrane lipoprotein Omp16 [Pyruvatibacter mobilis]
MTTALIRSRTMTFEGTAKGASFGFSGRAVKMALAGLAALALAACSSDPEQPTVQATTAPAPAAPAGPTPGSQQDLVVNVGDRVFFDTDQSSLRADARATLQRQAAWLNQYPNVRVTLEGHADERGTREYNLALGARRANSAKDYLVSLGVAPSRVQTISFGKERPVALCSDESCWAQNRRAVSVVTQGAGS